MKRRGLEAQPSIRNGKPRPSIDRRALSQAVTRAADASVAEVLSSAKRASVSHTRLIGVTGPPGAGKSTLVGRLAAHRVTQKANLAIVAVDPSSPLTQGSVLGDRVRMGVLGEDPHVFIRSLPSRQAHDGLANNMLEVLSTFGEFGFDEVLVETVGVGQAEYAVRALVDVEVLVLTPGAGDQIQALKAGIAETADVFVINKADLAGAARLEAEILGALRQRDCVPPVIRVTLGDEAGIRSLSEAIDERLVRVIGERDPREAFVARQRLRIQSLVQRQLQDALTALPDPVWDRSVADMYREVVAAIAGVAREPH